jgi:hypothetical protein
MGYQNHHKLPSVEIRRRCRQLVLEVAALHHVPPGYVTSHIRTPEVVIARLVVMRLMLAMGLKRRVIAMAFGRDLRRVRHSVLSVKVSSAGLSPAVHCAVHRAGRTGSWPPCR